MGMLGSIVRGVFGDVQALNFGVFSVFLVVFFVPREGQIWGSGFWVGAGVVLLDAFLILKSIP